MSEEPLTDSLKVIAVREIARQLGVTKARVDYAIDQLGLVPQARHSGVRVFLESVIPAIAAQIEKNAKPLPASRGESKPVATAGEAT